MRKKQILAGVLSIAMLATMVLVPNVLTVSASQSSTVALMGVEELFDYSEDFSESDSAYSLAAAFTGAAYGGTCGLDETAGVDGGQCFYIQSSSWGNAVSNVIADNLDIDKTYQFSVKAKGDICMLKLADGSDTAFESLIDLTASPAIGALERDFKEYKVTFTGRVAVKLYFKVQATNGINNGKLFIDNVRLVDVEALPEETPTPEVVPTEAPTVAPTQAPTTTPAITTTSPVATTAPTTVPTTATTPTATPDITKPKVQKVTVKFAKKSVKVKKGKKVVLKVTLKSAKKATFATSNKKVAKIMKKAAKSVTVKGMKKGKAVITAKASNKKATCKIIVTK